MNNNTTYSAIRKIKDNSLYMSSHREVAFGRYDQINKII